MKLRDNDGPWLLGHVEAHGISLPEIARALELNEEYVEKLLRGVHPLRSKHVLQVGILIGERRRRIQ